MCGEISKVSARDTPGGVCAPATILVVEDEEVVRDFLTSALELDGHTVAAVPNGKVALEYLATHTVDAILADCLMPVMGGCELHEELRRRQNPLADRMGFISGDMDRDPVRKFMAEHEVPTLQKPFGMMDLRELLARVLPG